MSGKLTVADGHVVAGGTSEEHSVGAGLLVPVELLEGVVEVVVEVMVEVVVDVEVSVVAGQCSGSSQGLGSQSTSSG